MINKAYKKFKFALKSQDESWFSDHKDEDIPGKSVLYTFMAYPWIIFLKQNLLLFKKMTLDSLSLDDIIA